MDSRSTGLLDGPSPPVPIQNRGVGRVSATRAEGRPQQVPTRVTRGVAGLGEGVTVTRIASAPSGRLCCGMCPSGGLASVIGRPVTAGDTTISVGLTVSLWDGQKGLAVTRLSTPILVSATSVPRHGPLSKTTVPGPRANLTPPTGGSMSAASMAFGGRLPEGFRRPFPKARGGRGRDSIVCTGQVTTSVSPRTVERLTLFRRKTAGVSSRVIGATRGTGTPDVTEAETTVPGVTCTPRGRKTDGGRLPAARGTGLTGMAGSFFLGMSRSRPISATDVRGRKGKVSPASRAGVARGVVLSTRGRRESWRVVRQTGLPV